MKSELFSLNVINSKEFEVVSIKDDVEFKIFRKLKQQKKESPKTSQKIDLDLVKSNEPSPNVNIVAAKEVIDIKSQPNDTKTSD